jgi:hypothetical protein
MASTQTSKLPLARRRPHGLSFLANPCANLCLTVLPKGLCQLSKVWSARYNNGSAEMGELVCCFRIAFALGWSRSFFVFLYVGPIGQAGDVNHPPTDLQIEL